MLLCWLPGVEKISQQHCLYWCRKSCLVHIAGTSKHTLNQGTSREGPWGNPSTNVLPWRAACVSCQLLKGLWSFGGGIFSRLHSSGKACFIRESWGLRSAFSEWLGLLKPPLMDEINDMWQCCLHLSEKDLVWNSPSSHRCLQSSESKGPVYTAVCVSYVAINELCSIDKVPLKQCLVFRFPIKVNPCKLLHSFQIKKEGN